MPVGVGDVSRLSTIPRLKVGVIVVEFDMVPNGALPVITAEMRKGRVETTQCFEDLYRLVMPFCW